MDYKKKGKLIYLGIVAAFIFIFMAVVLMERNIPYSSRAFVEYKIAPVFSKVSGTIDKIYVKNGDLVRENDLLFSLDRGIYEAQYESALGTYEKVESSLRGLDEDIKTTEDTIEKNRIIYERDMKDFEKYTKLYRGGYVTEIDYENSKVKMLQSEKTLKSSENQLKNELIKKGMDRDHNPELLAAKGALDRAKLQLEYTEVKAPIEGTVVMDQLYPNSVIKEGSTVFYLRDSNDMRVEVNLREKNIVSIKEGRKALVLFDGIPDTIYEGTVENMDKILADGYNSSNTLVNIPQDNRWVRDAGKVRVSIRMTPNENLESLVSGSKASVILLSPSGNPIYDFFGKVWLNIIKVFNYVY